MLVTYVHGEFPQQVKGKNRFVDRFILRSTYIPISDLILADALLY